MIKIWGKITISDKVIRNATIKIDAKKTTFFAMLQTLCQALNIPTPILLNKHVNDFNVFNYCAFKADDFVESIDFDRFILEHVAS